MANPIEQMQNFFAAVDDPLQAIFKQVDTLGGGIIEGLGNGISGLVGTFFGDAQQGAALGSSETPAADPRFSAAGLRDAAPSTAEVQAEVAQKLSPEAQQEIAQIMGTGLTKEVLASAATVEALPEAAAITGAALPTQSQGVML